ncbi:MAG TPA: N-acetyltransferase [Anaerolineales bacterium]|nr:N-acetyltransferase [Anaerolineales bacterium]
MKLSQLDDDGLRQLSNLHRSVMHTLLSDLGLPIVLKYYQAARSDSSILGICALTPSNEIVGWSVGSPDPAAINSKLSQPLTWFLTQMLRVAVTRPLVFGQLISSVFAAATEMEKDAIELTYIGVDSNHQGKGLGQALLNKFVEESRSKGYHSVVLSVEAENKTALALYEKSGFKIVRTFSEGHYQRHRMELKI